MLTDQENQQEVSEEDYQKLLEYAQENDVAWDQNSTAAEMLEKMDAGGYNAMGAYDMGQYAQSLPKDKTDIWQYIENNIAYGATEAIANPVNAAVTDTGDFFTGGGVSDSYRDLVDYFMDHPDEYRALMENDPSIAGYSYDSENGDQGSQFYQQLSEETGKSAAELGRFYNEYAASYSDSMNEITNGKSLTDLQKFSLGYIPHTMANILTTMGAFKVLDLALASAGDVGTSLADAGSAASAGDVGTSLVDAGSAGEETAEDLDSAYSAYKDASLDMEAADKADSDAINGLINQQNGGKMESSSIGDTTAAIPENVPVTPITQNAGIPYEEATGAEGAPYTDGIGMPESGAPVSGIGENLGIGGKEAATEGAGETGQYTQKIKWGIQDVDVRPAGKGFFGQRTQQINPRVDAYELKINPNNESYYLKFPSGGYVQYENMINDVVMDGKLVIQQKSFYHVNDLPEFARNKVLQEATRQVEAANNVGYTVEWLVSDPKAVAQLTDFFKSKNINIVVKYLPE